MNPAKRVVFGNMVNELMIAVPVQSHAHSLSAVSPRKVWLAQPGDLVVTPRSIEPPFLDYACAVLGVSPESIELLTPVGDTCEYLAHRTRRAGYDTLRHFAIANPNCEAVCFAQDRPTIKLFEELGIRIRDYSESPSDAVLENVYHLNTKAGARELMAKLGLRTAPGATCAGVDALLQEVKKLLAHHPRIIVKLNRSSNGHGNMLIDRNSGTEDWRSRVLRWSNEHACQPSVYVAESHLDFASVPSVEVQCLGDGPQISYICDMRCVNNAWTGMITPPEHISASLLEELADAGQTVGAELYSQGFRGVFDLDCGVTQDGAMVVTEANVRRTGGTYVQALVNRLVPMRSGPLTWVADSAFSSSSISFAQGIEALIREDLSFERGRQEGVVLTCDTRDFDGRWRYLVIAANASKALSLEGAVCRLLQFEETSNVAS